MFGSSMDFGGESADSLFTICQRQNLVTAQLWREKLPSLIDSATTVAHQARSCKPSLPTCSVLLTIVYNRGAALLSTRPGDRTAVCQLLRSTKVACDLIRTALYPLLHTLENPSRPSSSGTSSVNSSIALVLARHQENTSKVFVSSRAELTNDSPLDIAAAALILEQLTNLVFNQEGLVVNDSISESLAALQDAASRIVWLCSVHSLFRSDWSFMPILKRLRTLQLEATPSQIPAVNSLPVAAVSTVLLGTCSARSGLADTGAILSEVEEVAKSHRSGLANFVAGWICRLIDIRDERAKFYFERALVDYGTSAPVALLAQMGIVAVENADYELALLYFQASLEKDSTFMTSLVGKAVVARSLGWRAQEQDFLIRAVQEMYNRVRLIPRPALPSGLDPIRLLCWLTEVAPPQLSSPLLQKLEPYFSDLKALSHTPSRETRSNQLIPLNRLQRATIFVHLAAKSRVAARNSAREVLALDMWDPIACLGLLRCSVEGKSDASRDESEQNEESEWIEEANTFEEPFAVQEALQAGLRLVSLVETVWGDEPAVGRAAKPNNRPLGLRGFSATCGIPGVETVWTTAPEGVVHRIRKDQSLQRVLRHRSYHGLLGEAYGNLSTVLSMLGHSDQAVWFSNQAELLLPEKKTSVLFNTCLLELRRGGLNSAAPRWIGLRLRQSLEALPPRGVLALLARSMVADGHPLERAAALAGIAVPGKAPSRASGEEDGEAEEEGEAVVSPASIRWMDLQCLRALLKQPQHD
ncbi:hypothetical protein DFJ73DRAFT_865506 [Zopfochytrium polystomum]|nr:hypothetical protein DFJ73DRAFT_865506 [Zopfochytrium polystomum]